MKNILRDILGNRYSDGTKIEEVIERFGRIVYSTSRFFDEGLSSEKYLTVVEEDGVYEATRLFWNIYWVTNFNHENQPQ